MNNAQRLNAAAQEFQPGMTKSNGVRDYPSRPPMRELSRGGKFHHLESRGLPFSSERRYRVESQPRSHYDYVSQDYFDPWNFVSYERERRVRAKIAQAIRKDELMHRYFPKNKYEAESSHSKKKLKSQGRGFKSKQKKINVVYHNLIRKFSETGYLKEEVDRSYETCRVHAKTWDGLNVIEKALEDILNDESVDLKEIGFHKSMKNKYQQKGILVYIKVGSTEQVERLFDIYNSFGRHLKDHAIAVSKEEREKLRQEDKESNEEEPKEAYQPSTPTHKIPKTTMIVSHSDNKGSRKMIMQNAEVALLL